MKISRFNVFYRNVNNITLKIFPRYGRIYKFEREFNKYFGETFWRKSQGVYRNMNKCILRIILKNKCGIYTVYHFVDSNKLQIETSSKKRRQQN